jgi:DNA-binding response OmpR family regulator
MEAKLLIVEDDKALQGVLVEFLRNEGFIVTTADTGSDALRKIEKNLLDLVLLDLGLPDIQGETILKKVRGDYPDLPIIILTAKSKPQEVADGLNLGADDYLPKPFAAEELLARINARIKKAKTKNDTITVSDLTLNLSKMVAKRGSKNISLTKTEFELLKFLMENKGRVLSREIILNNVWGYTTEIESRVVDVYMGYLRKKIDKKYTNKLIKNKRGFGYYFDA